MKKTIFFSALLFFFIFVPFGHGDDLSDLKRQVDEIQQKIKVLENGQKAKKQNIKKPTSAPLEERLSEMASEIDFISQQQDSFIQTLEDMIRVNLYTTLEFENFQNTASTFDARNIELFFNARLTNRLKASAEIEFERTAKTSSGGRQGEVEVEQGWLEYSINKYINPRFGVVLVPFGKFNLEHFDVWRDLTERPILMRRIIPVTWAEAGAGFVGQAFLGNSFGQIGLPDFNVNYQFFLINGLTNAITDTSIRNARGSFGSDNNNNKTFVGRMGISPFAEHEIGVSGFLGAYDESGRDISGLDVDWDFDFGDLELLGEYAFFNLEKGGLQSGSSVLTVPEYLRGGYAQVNYHFWWSALNNTFLGRNFSSPTFTGVLRYGWTQIDDDNDAGVGDNKETRWTVGINYRPVEMFVFKFEYQFNHTDRESLERGNRDGFIASVSAAF